MILIVGATGFLGQETTRQLLAAGHRVRVMARTPEKAASLKEAGAEVVAGDLIDPASLQRACAGVEVVIAAAHSLLGRGRYNSPKVDDSGHRSLIDAAREAGVRHFVYTSAQGAAPDHPVAFYRLKYGVEQYLRHSGMTYTILRPSAFMEMHAHEFLGKSILEKGKTMIMGKGEQPLNFVSVRDVARYAVAALRDPRLRNQIVEIAGPDNVSRNAVAELYGRLSGRPPKVSRLPLGPLKVLGKVIRPLHPGISNLLHMNVYFDAVDMSYYPTENQLDFSKTTLEEFVRERVGAQRAEQAG